MQVRFRSTLNTLPTITSEPKISAEVPNSIYIFGPSRSGKSTLERLLGSLPDIQRGFESSILRNITRKTCIRSSFPLVNYAYQLPTSTDRTYLDLYLKELTSLVGERSFYTNTNPSRIFDVYHIARVIPNLRIVFVKRDIDDVVYRSFQNLYKTGVEYSYNLDAAREYITWYYSVQDKFAELLPHFTMTITYEDMVADPLRVANDVRRFCNIPSAFGTLPEIGDDRGASKEFKEILA